MKLNLESQKLIDILNVYLEEINEELLGDKDTLELLYEKKNVQDELKKKNAASNIRYNAFTPRKNEVEEAGEEETELLEQIAKAEAKVKAGSDKVLSIQKSITDFIDAYETILEEHSKVKEELKEISKEQVEQVKKTITEEKEDTKDILVKEEKDDSHETFDHLKLILELSSISSKLDQVGYTSVYDYKNTSSEIKAVKKSLDQIINNL